MPNSSMKKYSKQLSGILKTYSSLMDENETSFSYEFSDEDYIRLKTRSISAITNIVGENSVYHHQLKEILAKRRVNKETIIKSIMGVIRALSEDLDGGYLTSVRELARGELFSDYLEQAEYLLEEGFKDAAAVIAGSTLESHLRNLCLKNGIEVFVVRNEKKRPKKTNSLVTELLSKDFITTTNQKQLILWLDTRNNSAHGHYDKYAKEQVGYLIQGIRNFIEKYPA